MSKVDEFTKDLQEDKEYLKRCLECSDKLLYHFAPNVWWKFDDKVLSVARILDRYGQSKERTDIIDFFEKPYKYEDKMRFVIEEVR